MDISSNYKIESEADFIKFLLDVIELDEALVDINSDTRLIEDLMLDSLQLIRLITEIEAKFNTHIDISTLLDSDSRTVGELFRMTTSHKK